MRRIAITGFIAAFAITAGAQVNIVGPQTYNLAELADGSQLVTVVLEPDGVQDRNLEVVDVGPNYVAVRDAEGVRHSYLFSSIRRIEVQEDAVEERRFRLDESRALTADERAIVNQAITRARAIFDTAEGNQAVRMEAGAILAANGDIGALNYLRQLAESNDLQTALDAVERLYLANDSTGVSAPIARGLDSGNRQVRMQAALLAGLFGLEEHESRLVQMAQDRLAEIAAPAARALGVMGSQQAVPVLLDMVLARAPERAEAAVFALSRIGGTDVIDGLKQRLERATGLTRIRIAETLHNLGDPVGTRTLRTELLDSPGAARQIALILAREGDYEARRYLEQRLNERFNPTMEMFVMRAEMASALVQGQDRRFISNIQELLRTERSSVDVAVLELIGRTGVRSLMPLTLPKIESGNAQVALTAARTVMAIGDPSFRRRLEETRA